MIFTSYRQYLKNCNLRTIMKKLALLFIILFSQLTNSQKKEEIYVYFDHGKGQEKFYQLTKNGLDKEMPNYYIFYDCQYVFLMFAVVKNDNSEIRIENKSLLKKQNVIQAEKLLKMDLNEASHIFDEKKVFIIDTEEFKKNKIVLREVRVVSSGVHEM